MVSTLLLTLRVAIAHPLNLYLPDRDLILLLYLSLLNKPLPPRQRGPTTSKITTTVLNNLLLLLLSHPYLPNQVHEEAVSAACECNKFTLGCCQWWGLHKCDISPV